MPPAQRFTIFVQNLTTGYIQNTSIETPYAPPILRTRIRVIVKADFHLGRNWVTTGRNDLTKQ